MKEMPHVCHLSLNPRRNLLVNLLADFLLTILVINKLVGHGLGL